MKYALTLSAATIFTALGLFQVHAGLPQYAGQDTEALVIDGREFNCTWARDYQSISCANPTPLPEPRGGEAGTVYFHTDGSLNYILLNNGEVID